MQPRGLKLIRADELSLEAWLDLLKKHAASSDLIPGAVQRRKPVFVDYMFPTDVHRDVFLQGAASRGDEEIMLVLRCFLPRAGTYEVEASEYEWLLKRVESREVAVSELRRTSPRHARRIFESGISGGKVSAHDGIDWTIDLLPKRPKEAITAINAYLYAHLYCIPDGRIHGLNDAMAVIRARYLYDTPWQAAGLAALESMERRQFEYFTASIWRALGYTCVVTAYQKDGGVDVVASRQESGRKERVAIQCKRPDRRRVAVDELRQLRGIAMAHTYSRFVIVSTTGFTSSAVADASGDSRTELIDGPTLVRMANDSVGPTWPLWIERLVRESERGDLAESEE